MLLAEEYLKFWTKNGLEYIVPPKTSDPEGFSYIETLHGFDLGYVLEVGCGTGRIAKSFAQDKYLGVDINQGAITLARQNNPNHLFINGRVSDCNIKPESVLYYTVCLHIPDELISNEMSDAAETGAQKILIAEIMNPKYRMHRNKEALYDISNQRTLNDYCRIMDSVGFSLSRIVEKGYQHYDGQNMTFALFERKK